MRVGKGRREESSARHAVEQRPIQPELLDGSHEARKLHGLHDVYEPGGLRDSGTPSRTMRPRIGCGTDAPCPADMRCCAITGSCMPSDCAECCRFPPGDTTWACRDDADCFANEYCDGVGCGTPGGFDHCACRGDPRKSERRNGRSVGHAEPQWWSHGRAPTTSPRPCSPRTAVGRSCGWTRERTSGCATDVSVRRRGSAAASRRRPWGSCSQS